MNPIRSARTSESSTAEGMDGRKVKNHTPEKFEDNEVMVIDTTGKSAEVLARVWCTERGKDAISIRRAGRFFFVCAVR